MSVSQTTDKTFRDIPENELPFTDADFLAWDIPKSTVECAKHGLDWPDVFVSVATRYNDSEGLHA